MMQTPNSWSVAREKGGGGMVVNNNFYHHFSLSNQGVTPPHASPSARPHTRLQNTRDATHRADRRCPPAPEPPEQHGSTTGAAARRHIWMSDQTEISLAKRARGGQGE